MVKVGDFIKRIILILIFLLASTSTIYANKKVNIYYSKIDDNGNNYLKCKQMKFSESIEELDYVLKILFEEPFYDMDYKLNDIIVENYLIIDGEVILNVTGDIKKYVSSNDAINVRNQIVKSITNISNITSVTICIDNKIFDIGGVYIVKENKIY